MMIMRMTRITWMIMIRPKIWMIMIMLMLMLMAKYDDDEGKADGEDDEDDAVDANANDCAGVDLLIMNRMMRMNMFPANGNGDAAVGD